MALGLHGSTDVGFVLVDGFDILGTLTDVMDGGVEELTVDGTTLGTPFMAVKDTGLAKTSLQQSGFFDDTAASVHDAMLGNDGVSRVFCYALGGNLTAATFVGFKSALQTKFTRIAALGKMVMANALYVGSGEHETGVVLHPHQTEAAATGDTTATYVDNGAANADGASGYLQCSTDAFTTLTVKIRHSVDHVTWVDLFTFANVVPSALHTSGGGQRVRVEGTVNQYAACAWTSTGAGGAKFMVGLTRGKQ